MASHSHKSTRGVKLHVTGKACLQAAAWCAVPAPLSSAWETALIPQGIVKGKSLGDRSTLSEWIRLWREVDWHCMLRSSGAWACKYLLAWGGHPCASTMCIFFKGQSAVGGGVSLRLPAFPACRCQGSGWTCSAESGCRNQCRPPLVNRQVGRDDC